LIAWQRKPKPRSRRGSGGESGAALSSRRGSGKSSGGENGSPDQTQRKTPDPGDERTQTATTPGQAHYAARRSAATDKQHRGGDRREQFKAAKSLTGRTKDAPQPKKTKRRKSGEDTRDAFPPAMRAVAWRDAWQSRATATKSYLSETLDWLNLWQSNACIGSGFSSSYDAPSQNHSGLNL
jgi:hypothetical protein